MKFLTLALLTTAWVLFTQPPVPSRAYTDTCHVYVVNERAAKQFMEKTDLNALAKKSRQEQEAIAAAAGVGKTFEEFTTKTGEEQLTTRTYPFPNSDQLITASVYYTDEMMYSRGNHYSMLLGIVVAAKGYPDAISAPNGAVAEISDDEHVNAVRVKRKVEIKGQLYLVGLECRRSKPGSK